MKRNDGILLGVILLLAALLAGAGHLAGQAEEETTVVVSINGKEYGVYVLSENQTVELPGELGKNKLMISDGVVWMETAVCPDQYCVKQGKISKVGEQIVCLPNKIVVELTGEEPDSLDTIVY